MTYFVPVLVRHELLHPGFNASVSSYSHRNPVGRRTSVESQIVRVRLNVDTRHFHSSGGLYGTVEFTDATAVTLSPCRRMRGLVSGWPVELQVLRRAAISASAGYCTVAMNLIVLQHAELFVRSSVRGTLEWDPLSRAYKSSLR